MGRCEIASTRNQKIYEKKSIRIFTWFDHLKISALLNTIMILVRPQTLNIGNDNTTGIIVTLTRIRVFQAGRTSAKKRQIDELL